MTTQKQMKNNTFKWSQNLIIKGLLHRTLQYCLHCTIEWFDFLLCRPFLGTQEQPKIVFAIGPTRTDRIFKILIFYEISMVQTVKFKSQDHCATSYGHHKIAFKISAYLQFPKRPYLQNKFYFGFLSSDFNFC